MPKRSLKPCAKQGCRELVQPPQRYCSEHAHIDQEQKAQAERYYDTRQRDKQAKAFYASPGWRAVREAVLIRDHYLCQTCLRQQRTTPADTVHHKVELRVDWSRRLDMDNLESVCSPCHNAERRIGSQGRGQGE
jgi:5-methylcytosine-specific restriction protein A